MRVGGGGGGLAAAQPQPGGPGFLGQGNPSFGH